ncbi:hypothetical protein ACQEVY_05410 [Streptomyces sp. CA-288835]
MGNQMQTRVRRSGPWTGIYSNPGNRFVSDKYLTAGGVQSFLPKS